MFYDDKMGVIQEESNIPVPITTKGIFIIIILLGIMGFLIANLVYADSNLFELSATAMRSCAGCAGK